MSPASINWLDNIRAIARITFATTVATGFLLTAAVAGLVVPVLLPRVADSVTGTVSGVAARLRQRRALVEATPPLVATLMDPGPVGSGRAPEVGFRDTPFPSGADGGVPPTDTDR